MRRTTVVIAGLGTAILAWVNGPLFDTGAYMSPSLSVEFGYTWPAAIVVLPLLIAVVGGTLAAFRALWLSTRRAELAAHIALGRTRLSLIGEHVRTGLLDGTIAAASGIFVGGLAHQFTVGFSRLQFVPSAFLNYVLLAVWVTWSFVLAYWVAAAWATRGSVLEVASGYRADARAGSRTRAQHRRGWRAWAWRAWAWVAGAVVVAVAVAIDMNVERGWMADAAAMVLAIVGLVVVPALLIYGAATFATWLVRRVSQRLARTAPHGSPRSLATDSLARPTPMRTGAAAAVIAVMGVSVVMSTVVFALTDTSATADELIPHASVSTTALRPDSPVLADEPAGWSESLPPELLEQFRADPALTVIEAGVLVSDLHTTFHHGQTLNTEGVRDVLVAANPADLDAVVADASKQLYFEDGMMWSNGIVGRADGNVDAPGTITVNGVHAQATAVPVNAPWHGVSRAWAEDIWGPAPTAAVMLYPAGSTAVDRALTAYDLDGLSLITGEASFGSSGVLVPAHVALLTAPFLLIAVIIVVALAWSGQRLRAKEQATLLALGATPPALRGAAAIESGVITLIAGTVGLVAGALIGPVFAVFNTVQPGTPGPDLLLWNAVHALTTAPWGMLIALVIGAAAIAAGGAALIRVRLDRLSPAQQLTEGQKVGVA